MTPTPFQDLLDADTSLALEDVLGPAEEVTLIDGEGNAHALRALYEAPGLDVTPDSSHAPVVSTAPRLHIQMSLVQSILGRPLSRRDSFLARGKSYRVQQPLEDGYGLLAVKLLEKNDA
ncbi:MAG: hypothetical protein LBQ63_05115 [Deltaproteobacteria bacterium]|jgi:hypothetical protein|nr:hypothetical protein [Deltaproteobacteria bacterium]